MERAHKRDRQRPQDRHIGQPQADDAHQDQGKDAKALKPPAPAQCCAHEIQKYQPESGIPAPHMERVGVKGRRQQAEK